MLGGLMRGTMGAFIRGGLDTATGAIQQANLQDQEEIKQKLENFSAKHEKYQEGLKEYDAETALITDVSSILANQDDAILADLDEDQLQGVAQSLITMSGAEDASKALEYFITNRDNLVPKQIAKPNTSQDANTQTSQMLTTGDTSAAEPEKPNFLKRLFTGKTDQEIRDAVIESAGVSPEVYDSVVSGSMPTRPGPSMGLSVTQADPLKDILKDNNTGVMGAIATGSDIYRDEEGAALARSYVSAYANYMTKADDAMAGSELLDLQNKILTYASAPEAKDFFAPYDNMLSSLNGLLFSDNIAQAQKDKAMPVYKKILDMKRKAVADPEGFGSDVTNAHAFSETVFELGDILDIANSSDQFKIVGELLDKTIEHARTNSDQYTEDQLTTLFALPQALSGAKQDKDYSVIPGLFNTLEEMIPEKQEEGDTQTDYMRKRSDLTKYYMSDSGGGHSEEDAYNMAVNHLNSGGFVTVDGVPMVLTSDENGGQALVRVPIVKDVGGTATRPRPKVESENKQKILKNNNSIGELGNAIQLLAKNPNGFNFIGDFILRTQDGIDMARSAGIPIEGFDTEAAEIQTMRQNTIPLISTAKDALFEDPRLSDQDLRIVLDYVAVINDAGIGTTRATQAMLGLMEALAIDNALRLHENTPELAIANFTANGRINIFTESGELDLDSTVAGRTMQNIAGAMGFEILNKEQYQALNEADRKRYGVQMERVGKMTERVVARANAFRDLGANPETYRTNYANQSSLFSYGNVITPVSALQTELDKGAQRLEARLGQ